METKTEILENVQLALPPTATMAQLQKEVEIKMGWDPINKLERLASAHDEPLLQGHAHIGTAS